MALADALTAIGAFSLAGILAVMFDASTIFAGYALTVALVFGITMLTRRDVD